MAKDEAAVKIQAFEEQILPVLPLLYRAALRLTGEVTEAEDLVQDTCRRAFQLLEQLRHPRAAKAWVFSILRSVFVRRITREASRVHASASPALSLNTPPNSGEQEERSP